MQERHLKRIIELRHELHRVPEVSMKERRTKETLMAFISRYTSLQVVDRGRWFYAWKEGETDGDRVAFRADMDALPIPEEYGLPYASEVSGVSHRCGHDGHCAALAGLALELDSRGKECKNTVYLIFQHGEEIGGGGEECAGLIEEKDIARVYAFHNWSGFPEGSVVLRDGIAQCASMGVILSFAGKTAHASRPEDGINPASALANLTLFVGTEALTSGYDGPVWATIVGLSAGTGDFGIAASNGHLSVTLRAERDCDLKRLSAVIREKATSLAARDGLRFSFREQDVFPDTVNNTHEIARVRKAAGGLGLPVIEKKEPFKASEDFGHFLKHCPGAMIYIGNGEDYPPIHTMEYDFNDKILETAVDLFAELAIQPKNEQ